MKLDIDVVHRALLSRYEPYEDGEWFTLSFIGGSVENLHFPCGEVERAVEVIKNHAPCNTYSTMSVFGKEPPPNRKGSAAAVTRCAWLWADLDCHLSGQLAEVALERLHAFKPAPSIIYFSGRGYHAYWRLRPVCVDMPSIVERNRWIAQNLWSIDYKVDHVHNVDRIMRVPGTVNTNV